MNKTIILIMGIVAVLIVSGCISSGSSFPLSSSGIVELFTGFIFLWILFVIVSVILLIKAPRFCGALFVVVGTTLTITILGAAIGIPLILIGVILIAIGGKKHVDVHVHQQVNQKTEREMHKTEEKTVPEHKEKEDPLNILKKRYAKGEITKKKYEEMKKDLE